MRDSEKLRPTRREYLGASAAAMLGGAAGCLDGITGGSGDEDGTTVELYTWNLAWLEDTIEGWQEDFLDEFGDEYDDLDTEWTDRGPETESILSYFEGRLRSDDPPNVFDTQTTAFAQYAEEGLFADVEELDDDGVLDRYSDNALDILRYDDTLVQMPFYIDTSFTACNSEHFEAAGVEPPTVDEPWDTFEYLDNAEEIVDNSDAEFGLTHIRFDYNFWPYWRAEGVDVLTDDGSEAAFNTDTTVEILERFQELTEGGYMPEVAWTGVWEPPAEQFGTGNTAMYFGSGSALRLVRSVFGDDWVSPETVDVAHTPVGERHGGMFMSYHGFGIVDEAVSDTAVEAAFDFTSVATNQKWQEDFLRNTTVLVPHEGAMDAVRNDDEFAEDNPLLVQLYDQYFEVEDDLGRPPTVPASPQIADILDTEFSAAALGEKDPQEAVDDAEERVNEELN